jgi:asparagine synthase (glutamine-hydrolysing)
MSGICAIYSRNGEPCNRELLTRMSQFVPSRGDITGAWSKGPIGLAMTVWQQHQSPPVETLPYFWHSGEYCIAADARLSQREVLIQTLQANQMPLQDTSDTALLIAAYRLWGERCVDYLQGDFAFVVWDGPLQRLFAARSPMGLRPLVYHINERRFLCASEPRQLLTDPTIARELSEDWMLLWLTEGIDSWNRTAFRDIQELVPGQMICVDRQGITITPFWTPFPRVPLIYQSQQDYLEHFRHLLFAVMQDHLQSDRRVLFDLSGGLDSSSLVCLAQTLLQQGHPASPISALHVSSSRYREVDDLVYAHLVAQKYGVDLQHLSYDTLPAFDGIFDPRPWTSTPTIPTLFLTRLYQKQWQIAQDLGIRSHVRGDFGDQLFCASLTYLTTYWDEHHPDEFWREAETWERVHGMNRHDLFTTWVLKPHHHRRRPYLERSHLAPWIKAWMWKRHAELLQQDEVSFREHCPDPLARQLFRWMRYHKEYVSMQEDGIVTAGLETCEPYTDLRLIEFMLATPPQYQIRPDQRKFLLRAAMEGLLPEPVRQRKDKGRVSRVLFRGIAGSRDALREHILHLPDMLSPYIDAELLAASLDRVALGDDVHQPTFFSALALVLWAHRLPWSGGMLSGSPSEQGSSSCFLSA